MNAHVAAVEITLILVLAVALGAVLLPDIRWRLDRRRYRRVVDRMGGQIDLTGRP